MEDCLKISQAVSFSTLGDTSWLYLVVVFVTDYSWGSIFSCSLGSYLGGPLFGMGCSSSVKTYSN